MKKAFFVFLSIILGIFSVAYAESITLKDNLNVQENISNPKVVFQYKTGDTIEYDNLINNEWLKVQYAENKYGYVNAKLISNFNWPQQQESGTISAPSTPVNGTDQLRAGQAIASLAIDAVRNHKNEFIYSYGHNGSYVGNGRQNAYRGIKTSGVAYGTSGFKAAYQGKVGNPYPYSNRYSVDCVGFVSFVIRHSLHIGSSSYTRFVTSGSGAISGNGFKNIKGISVSKMLPGDIIYKSGHVMIYVGKDSSGQHVIAHAMNKSRSNVPEKWGIMFGTIDKNKRYNVARITESKAKQIREISTSL